jgi:hypothetical protein
VGFEHPTQPVEAVQYLRRIQRLGCLAHLMTGRRGLVDAVDVDQNLGKRELRKRSAPHPITGS